MRLLTTLTLLLSSPLPALTATLSPQTLTISLASPDTTTTTPYIDIHYDPSSLTATLLKTHSPSIPAAPLLTLGFHRPDLIALSPSKEKAYTSILLPPSAFSSFRDRTLTLLVDRAGVPYHLSFSSVPAVPPPSDDPAVEARRKRNPRPVEGSIKVEVEQIKPGPGPVLNKPVVLSRDGRVEGQEPEKSFLQKYWWAIGIFLVIQVVAGGGGGEK
ncbi:hypothetical protein BDZ85DRAFT_247648 [Elsinoe ampelina]|uniref:ER membrane protein complex subunit 10 n=1 Tax=Elsinoe ampelina TaxID=302913 RepID=A0A6A6GIW4_9PEZI|nr:hypothetical protein BDZ85DRAFT_247648 [Elsinoe ampelina]